jgi:hypothetical protein
MAGGLIDFTGKALPPGATVGAPAPASAAPAPDKSGLIDFTGKSLPPGATVGGPLGGPNAEMWAAPSPSVRAAENIGTMGLMGAGGLLGGPVGASLGGTVGDIASEVGNYAAYGGQKPVINPSTVQKDLLQNMGGVAVGEVAGPVVSKGLANMGGDIIGKRALGQAAQETAEEAGQVGQKAYEKQAGANLKERTDTSIAAGETLGKAQDSLASTRANAEQGANEKIGGLKDKVAQELQPEARQAAIQDSLGRSPEQTQKSMRGTMETTPEGVSVPGPGMTNRQTDFWNSVYQPIHKMSDALGSQYDKLFEGVADQPANTTAIARAVEEEGAYSATHGVSYSPAVQKLLSRADAMGGKAPEVSFTGSAGAERFGSFQLTNEQIAQMNAQAGKGGSLAGEPATTINQLRGLRSDASALVSSSANGRDKAAAQNIVDAADDALEQSNVLSPKGQAQLKGLNGKWRSYKTTFDRSLLRKIGSTNEPVDAASEIFDDPKRFSLLTANADKDQLSTLRRTYADWVNTAGDKVIKDTHAPDLQKLFPGTPLANPKSWIYLDKSLTKFEDVIRSNPQVQQKALRIYQEQLRNIRSNAAQSVVDDATKYLPKLGNTGQRIIAQMKAAKTPEEAADIAAKGIEGMTPQQLGQETMPVQKSPEAAQREAIIGTQSPKAAQRGMIPPTTPDEAAIQAIQTGQKPKSGGGGIMSRIARNYPLYVLVSAAYLAENKSPSPYMGGMAIGGLLMAGSEGIRGSVYKYLADHPESAARMWQAVTNPGTDSNFKYLMNMAAKASIAKGMAGGAKMATGQPFEPPEDNKVGPAVKATEKSRAEAIAPVPSASKRAAELSKDIHRAVKPADVQNDLSRGRLSMDEVKKTLQHAGKGTSAMLDGIPITEAFDAVEMGTPEEKQTLVPLLQQRMRAEMAKQNGNRTMQAKLAMRMKALTQGMNAPAEANG